MREETSTLASTPAVVRDLSPLLRARSVAIVGISTPGKFGGYLYNNIRGFGYEGPIYGVNPRYETLYDQPCYPSLSELPEAPDCAILAISNRALLGAMQEAASLGIPSTVIFGNAYLEPVEGEPTLQESLAQVARQNNMILCGPNGMGFLSVHEKLFAAGEPIPELKPGGVTFISHSGSVYDALLQNTRDLHFNYLISSGNEIAVTMADYMLHALETPSTKAIGLFLETVRDPVRFEHALGLAAGRDIPIVALKIGRSERGARLAQAHSGAIAGEDGVYDALFAYYGVRRVASLDELTDTLELLSAGFRTATPYVSSIHDSGGERGLLVDLADSLDVPFAPITEDTSSKLAAVLEPGLAPINPLDAWGTFNNFENIYRECLLALDGDPSTAITLFAVDLWPVADLTGAYVDIVIELKDRLTKPLVFLVNLAAATSQEESARSRAAGFPVLMGTENGIRAVKHLLEYSEFQRRWREDGTKAPIVSVDSGEAARLREELAQAGGPLDEHASKRILSAYGITVPAETIASTLEETLEAAKRIGYPVVVKTAAGETHKSDKDGVRLNVADDESLTRTYHDFAARLGPRVLVQQMVQGGTELLLGMVNDDQFGPMVMLGTGGIFVEVLKDHRLLKLPTRRETVVNALDSLRGAALLDGARGRPPADREAVADAILRMAALVGDLGDLIAEIDVNPLIALPNGAVAVDALIIPRG